MGENVPFCIENFTNFQFSQTCGAHDNRNDGFGRQSRQFRLSIIVAISWRHSITLAMVENVGFVIRLSMTYVSHYRYSFPGNCSKQNIVCSSRMGSFPQQRTYRKNQCLFKTTFRYGFATKILEVNSLPDNASKDLQHAKVSPLFI